VSLALGAIALVALVQRGDDLPPPSALNTPRVAQMSPGAVGADAASPVVPTRDSITVPNDTIAAGPRDPVVTAPPASRPRSRATPANERSSRSGSSVRPRSTPRAPAAAPEPGRLSVSSRPWGSLYVDGVLVGNTPRANIAIPIGTHRIRIVRNGFVPFERVVTVAAGDRVRLVDIVLQAVPR
jgi:hypothetical protein